MRNLKDMLNEALVMEKEFDADTKPNGGDSATFGTWVKPIILAAFDGFEAEDIRVSGDGVKIKNRLVPDTKLVGSKTAGEIAETVIAYVNSLNEWKGKCEKNLIIKKLNKNAGMPRGMNYEKFMARLEKARDFDSQINREYLDRD